MNYNEYIYKLIILGDRGVGRTTLEKYLDQDHPLNRRAFYRDLIKDIDQKIDEYRILRENLNSIIRKLHYSLRIKREIKKKKQYLEYLESQISTRSVLGISFQNVLVEIRGKRIILQLWVLGDQERYRSLRKLYVNGSSGAILLYDITNESSLNRIPEWREKIAELCGEIPIVLIGNKLDLEEQRVISNEKGMEILKKNNLSLFMEVSTETGENVERMFELIGELMFNAYSNE